MTFRQRKNVLNVVKNRKLTQLVHLALVVHLLLAGFLFGLAAAAATYYLRSDEIADGVLARATRNIDLLRMLAQQMSRERSIDMLQAAQKVLPEWQDDSLTDHAGRFVAIRVLDSHGKPLLDRVDHSLLDARALNRLLNGIEPRRRSGNHHFELVQIESNALIHIQAPIMNESGDVIAQIRGLYLLSEKTRASLQRDIISGALFSFAIILLTTLVLYPVILLLVRRLGRLTESLLHSNLEMLQVIGSAIAKRDSDTDAHNYRVCLYSVQLARELDLPRSELRRLLKGAFLHDVGKIGISDQILHKPGPLDAEETKLMRQHVPLGLDIICRSHWLADASEVVGSHHERLDGNGYPQGLIGEDIPLLARIFAIADVFDALCSVRPYKKAFPLETALDIMRQASGKHFDQKLLTVFEGLAGSLHARYYGRKIEELREELGAILDAAFSDKLSQLTKFYEKS